MAGMPFIGVDLSASSLDEPLPLHFTKARSAARSHRTETP
jgi:hypothetical protein